MKTYEEIKEEAIKNPETHLAYMKEKLELLVDELENLTYLLEGAIKELLDEDKKKE